MSVEPQLSAERGGFGWIGFETRVTRIQIQVFQKPPGQKPRRLFRVYALKTKRLGVSLQS